MQLLGQLAPERVGDRLALDVVLAGGDLQHPGPDGVAPLVDQDDHPVVVDDQGGHGPVVLDDLAVPGLAVVVGDPVDRTVTTLPSKGRRVSTIRNGGSVTGSGAPGLAGRERPRRDRRVVVVTDRVGQPVTT